MSDIGTARMLGALASGRDLGDFERCPVCEEYDWTAIHHCKMQWLVSEMDVPQEERSESATIVYADNAEEAGEAWANKTYDSDYHPSMAEIAMKPAGAEDEAWEVYTVSMEMVPSFTIMRKEYEPEETPRQE